MADDITSDTSTSSGGFQGGPGREANRRSAPSREAGGREPGGFRIRLSDNEMRAARAVQEAFRLRSTVAALGFSIRTLAQLLEEGKLDGLLAEQRSQADGRPDRGRGERRTERPAGARIDPFARPSRPAPPVPETPADAAPEEQAAADTPLTDAAGEAASGEASDEASEA
jgi:hypothetical protein